MTTSSTRLAVLLLQIALVGTYIVATAHAQSNRSGPPLDDGHNKPHALPSEYQEWLNQDVRWIITPEEEAAFIRLSKNEDRDQFVEQFWLRRDPTPSTRENEYKAEHYRRIAYSNAHFAAGMPGWNTDRGRIYIVYGPPDEITVQPALSGGESAKRMQVWHYLSLPGYGKDIDLKFVDVCSCGDYRLETPLKN